MKTILTKQIVKFWFKMLSFMYMVVNYSQLKILILKSPGKEFLKKRKESYQTLGPVEISHIIIQTQNYQKLLYKNKRNPKQTEIKINDHFKHKDNRY